MTASTAICLECFASDPTVADSLPWCARCGSTKVHSEPKRESPREALQANIDELRAICDGQCRPVVDVALLDHVERQAREYGTRPNRSFAYSTVGGANVARFADAVLVLTDALRRGPGAGGA